MDRYQTRQRDPGVYTGEDPGGGRARSTSMSVPADDDWFTTQGAPPTAPPAPAAPPPAAPGVIGQDLENTPGYQFRLNQGLQALERSAASRGTLMTGGQLKGLTRYAQDVASQEYDKRVQQLTGLAGMGLGAAGTQAQVSSAYGRQATDLITDAGNAAAAGTIGATNAWGEGLGGIANMAQLYYLNQLFNPPAPSDGVIRPRVPIRSGVPRNFPGQVPMPLPPPYFG